MAYAAWAASTSYAIGAIVRATTVQDFGLVFKCTTAGTSGANAPAWPTLIEGTTADGGVTWTAISAVYEDLSVLAPNAIVELFQLHLDATLHGSSDIYYFHNGVNADVTGNVVWDGQPYVRLPLEASGFDYSSTGSLPRPKLTVSNIGSSITALLLQVNMITAGNDLGGAKVVRIRTLKKYLDGQAGADPHAKFPDEIWYVDRKSNENRAVVEFELASKFDLVGVMIPRRQIIANVCQWVYRGGECGYTGSNYWNAQDQVVGSLGSDACGKRIESCKLRFGSLTRSAVVTSGSTSMTVDTTGLKSGISVVGFGIPSSTTISTVNNSTTLTLSAASTATTSLSLTGTPSATAAEFTVSSASALGVGMTVTGTYIPPVTTIVGISGATLTLSQRPYSIVRTGTFKRVGSFLFVFVFEVDTTGLSVGMKVFGDNGIETTILGIGAGTISLDGYFPWTLPPGTALGEKKTVYFMPASPGSGTYSFQNNTLYAFGDTTSVLPFGSFPGAGLSK